MPDWYHTASGYVSVGPDRQWLVLPTQARPKKSQRIVVWHHGAGGETNWIDPAQETALPQHHRVFKALLAAGYGIFAADFGRPSADEWGNDHSMFRVEKALTWLLAQGFSSRFAWLGTSMGFLVGCKWAHLNSSAGVPIYVNSITGMIPCTDAAYCYSLAPFIPVMDGAYGGTGMWPSYAATTDPMQIPITNLQNVQVRMYYAADDTTVGDSRGAGFSSRALATRLGANASAIAVTSANHTDASLATIDTAALVTFLNARTWDDPAWTPPTRAITIQGKVAAGSSNASGTTVTVTFTAATQVGDLLTMVIAADNLSATTPTVSSITDTKAVWTERRFGAVNATAAAGVVGDLWSGVVKTAHIIGDTLTVNISGAVTGKAVVVRGARGVRVSATPTVIAAATTGASTTPAATLAPVELGSLVVGALAFENATAATPDADTTGGAWNAGTSQAGGGAAAAGVTALLQDKIAATLVTQAFDPTKAGADEWVVAMMALPPA